jgi:CRISPR/Cas system CSM-associated protein Csm2 small subunit
MQHRNRDRRDRRPERSLDEIWPGYLKDGYFDREGNLDPIYVSRDRVDPLAKEMSKVDPPLNNHQLRRFFMHCRSVETRLKSGSSTWSAEVSNFKKLDIAAADGYGKSPKKIPRLFYEFIKRNVSVTKNRRDFIDGFLPHFEALVGFGQQYLRDRERS